jgi:hypothetical protein
MRHKRAWQSLLVRANVGVNRDVFLAVASTLVTFSSCCDEKTREGGILSGSAANRHLLFTFGARNDKT